MNYAGVTWNDLLLLLTLLTSIVLQFLRSRGPLKDFFYLNQRYLMGGFLLNIFLFKMNCLDLLVTLIVLSITNPDLMPTVTL
ncbi:hypothetical protein SAMN05444392_12416 [Seinonella peptonophila]|uniref:Uncharacterized protein n=1 Tax=Seinonella peptonophila TaxID=112248 RepID=A0A1M5BHX6_9BACL|nr:hypothetical protein SAMN05444392_12416 [Seinonella peptonophila]